MPPKSIGARKRAGAGKKPQRKAVVVLTVGRAQYRGTSSGQYGHAEMDALRKSIVACQKAEEDPVAKLRATRARRVKRPNQPACPSCAKILKALGFSTAGGTTWGLEKSGGVSWGANLTVEAFRRRSVNPAITPKPRGSGRSDWFSKDLGSLPLALARPRSP